MCPSCGDGAVVEDVCGRCDVVTVPRSTSVVLPGGRSRTAPAGSLALIVLGALTVLGVPTALFFATQSMDSALMRGSATTPLVLALWALVPGAAAALAFGERVAAQVRLRRARSAAARRRDGLRSRSTAGLPAEAATPVRVEGRIRVEDGALTVVDDAGRARVEVGPSMRAYRAHEPLGALRDGDEVEVVGVGRRQASADDPGAGYREAGGAFVFDGASPLEVWVRR